jgi:hypothetical protein
MTSIHLDSADSLLPSDDELRVLLAAMAAGDQNALASLVVASGPWLFPVAERLLAGDSIAAASLCERLFVVIWRMSPCYDGNHGPPMAWMLLVLRELAAVPVSETATAYPADSGALAQLWFGEKGGTYGA